jgi:acyl-CoA synthetase (NDP forming)
MSHLNARELIDLVLDDGSWASWDGSVEESVLTGEGLLRGRRVAVLTNAGGPGALTAGACRAAGLELAELAAGTRAILRNGIGPEAGAANPVDLTPMGGAAAYRIAMNALLDDDGVDAVIALFIPPVVDRAEEVAEALVTASARVPTKPVLASFRSQNGVPTELRGPVRAIPSYLFPESAASALGLAAEYSAWRRQVAGFLRDPTGLDIATAQRIVGELPPGRVEDAVLTRLLAVSAWSAPRPTGRDRRSARI